MEGRDAQSKMGPHMTAVLIEMCRRVGAEFDDVNFREDGWFRRHAWTQAEQDDFKEWLAGILYTVASARRELLEYSSRRSKRHARKAADEFVFQYGWVMKEVGDGGEG